MSFAPSLVEVNLSVVVIPTQKREPRQGPFDRNIVLFSDRVFVFDGGDEMPKKTALLEWVRTGGRTVAWVADQIQYSYQQTWIVLHGRAPVTERFVVQCFSNLPGLPPDVFEEQGYVLESDGFVYKRIPSTKA